MIRLRQSPISVGLLVTAWPLWVAANPGLQPMDIFQMQQAVAPSISPNGRTVTYALIRRDVTTDTKDSAIEISRDLVNWTELPDSDGCSTVVWSPDSRRFALLCDRDQHSVLEVRSLDSAGRSIIADGPERIADAAWSPDSQRIAYERFVRDNAWKSNWELPSPPPGARWAVPFRAPVERMRVFNDEFGPLEPGSFQTFLATVGESSEPKQLTSGIWWTGFESGGGPDLAWSADGREILISANRSTDWDMHADERYIYSIDTQNGNVRRVTDQRGTNAQPAVSPDGRWLAYTGVEERGLCVQNRRIYVMSTTSAQTHGIAVAPNLDRSIDQYYWLPGSDGFVVSYEDDGSRILAIVSVAGKVVELARSVGGETLELPFSPGRFAAARDGTAVFLRSSATIPSDVAVKRLGVKERIIAHLNGALEARIGGFTAVEPFWISASTDGVPVQAWLMRAREGGSTRAPLILDIHGGPFAQYGDRFSLKYQLYVSAGYNVVFANPRGSTGYGEHFADLAHNNWPGQDGTDLLDVAQAAALRDFVDPHALFVTGTSGGATMSLWLVAHSDRFRAAVASKPLVDWISWTLTSDFGAEMSPRWLGGTLPWNNVDAYWRRSPVSLAGKIHTPVLLISGDEDLRAPPWQALEMFTALKLAGVEAALVRGPEVTHNSVAYRPSMFLQEVAYTLDWFNKHRVSHACNVPPDRNCPASSSNSSR